MSFDLAALQPWQNDLALRNLNSPSSTGTKTSFSDAENRAVLIAGLSCACISFVAASIALRWFVLMKRCFRHRLVLFLIASDTFKAVWYFVFAVVAISRGPVTSSSSFCQVSGFFLLFGVEAADFAILIIALHTLLAIFKPTSKAGEGGLYPYRSWIYLIWLCPPLLASCLAFVNDTDAYTTSGTYCYLPKRPFWYRLALSWIPRYIIISTILIMYASIYVYVHIKFRGFSVLVGGGDDSSQKSDFASKQSAGPVPSTADQMTLKELVAESLTEEPPKPPNRPSALRMPSYSSIMGPSSKSPPVPSPDAPWEALSFITAKPLQDQGLAQPAGVTLEEFAQEAGSTGSQQTRVGAQGTSNSNGKTMMGEHDSRKASEAPTMQTNYTGETAATHATFTTMPLSERDGTVDHLRETRLAIRRQLRFLFIYPVIYILMWAFPFAAHALNYHDYYVNHPIFWLSVVQTCSLALQAGVDSVVFSLREKPWRRIDDNSVWSIPRFRGQLVSSVQSSRGRSNPPSTQTSEMAAPTQAKRNPSHWWEAEGRKRKDSVWMGTDVLSRLTSNRDQRSLTDEREKRGEQSDGSDRSSTKSRK